MGAGGGQGKCGLGGPPGWVGGALTQVTFTSPEPQGAPLLSEFAFAARFLLQ